MLRVCGFLPHDPPVLIRPPIHRGILFLFPACHTVVIVGIRVYRVRHDRMVRLRLEAGGRSCHRPPVVPDGRKLMGTLIMCTLWTLAAGFIGYSIANVRAARQIRMLRESRYWLRRRCDDFERRLVSTEMTLRRYQIERLNK